MQTTKTTKAIEELGYVLAKHDQLLFNTVANINALVDTLIEKGIIKPEELEEASIKAINELRDNIINSIQNEEEE